MNTFILGEPVKVHFRIENVDRISEPTQLQVIWQDEHGRVIAQTTLPIASNQKKEFDTWLDSANDRLGFYRVYAHLTDGTLLASSGSRPAGYITYAIVPPLTGRPQFGMRETHFGALGSTDPLPYSGGRWVVSWYGTYGWRFQEPDRPGEFLEKRDRAFKEGHTEYPQPDADFWRNKYVGERKWKPYHIYALFLPPKWAAKADTSAYATASLTPDGEQGWRSYSSAIAHAVADDARDEEEHIYQITWEPVFPWGFKGTLEDLIQIYAIAYPQLHRGDPKAVVIGPTGGSIVRDLDWNVELLKRGLGKYIDGFSIHPYVEFPPEQNGLIPAIEKLKRAIRQYTGRDMAIYGTEHGYKTKDQSDELSAAQGLIRCHIIFLGEGFKTTIPFMLKDAAQYIGYGYYYNLDSRLNFEISKASPRPVAPAYAALVWLLEGRKSLGRVAHLDGTAIGYVFRGRTDLVAALWDYGPTPRTVTLSTGVDHVVIYDWMGNSTAMRTVHGTLRLTLSGEPIYVKGISPLSPNITQR